MSENTERIGALHGEIQKLTAELKGLLKSETVVDVSGYKFSSGDGDVSFDDLFGDKDDLMIVHNMGKSCVYCTTYADGVNGILHHLENRCSVALLSPDSVSTQKDFAFSRGWKFRMISSHEHGEAFNTEMGFYQTEGEMAGHWPGFSAFRRDGDTVIRTGHSYFDPGDEYCVLFPMMEFLRGGQGDWQPQFQY